MGNIGSGTGSSFPTTKDTQSSPEVDSPNARKTKARAAVVNDLASAILAIEGFVGTKADLSVLYIRPEWYGAVADGVTDCTAAIQAAYDSCDSPHIKFSTGTYLVTDTITFSGSNHSAIIEGNGKNYGTNILFKPTEAKTLFLIDGTSSNYSNNIIIEKMNLLTLDANGDYTKVAIETQNTDHVTIRDVNMVYWKGNNDSVGIKLGGRQLTFIENVYIYGDLGISIVQNPQRSGVGNIDCDHLNIRNSYIVAEQGSIITIATGVNLTNVTIDGTNSWVPKSYGIYWNDTTSSLVSMNLSVSNVRLEQETETGSYMFYINRNSTLQNLSLKNISGGLTSKGIYLRNILNATIENFIYSSSSNEAINIDSTSSPIRIINCFWQTGSTATISGLYLDGFPADNGTVVPIINGTYYNSIKNHVMQIGMTGDTLTVGIDETLAIVNGAATSGFLFVTSSAKTSALFLLKGAYGSVELIDSDSWYSITKDTAGSINVYYDTGVYYIQNKRVDASFNFKIILIGSNAAF
jgi:hypothetical protein